MLLDLAQSAGAELAWASFWCDHANTWIAPKVGLPQLPFVPIPSFPGLGEGTTLGAWKVRHVVSWVERRPFVWFEDEPDVVECLANESGLADHLLVSVDPQIGLTEEHIERAGQWLAELSA